MSKWHKVDVPWTEELDDLIFVEKEYIKEAMVKSRAKFTIRISNNGPRVSAKFKDPEEAMAFKLRF